MCAALFTNQVKFSVKVFLSRQFAKNDRKKGSPKKYHGIIDGMMNVNRSFNGRKNFSWNLITGSANTSLMSIKRPFLIQSGCFLSISQPTWAKKKPRFELCGSALVSEYL